MSKYKATADPRMEARKNPLIIQEQKKEVTHFTPLSTRGLENISKKRLLEKIEELDAFEAYVKKWTELCIRLNRAVPNFIHYKTPPAELIKKQRERMLNALAEMK